MDKVKEIIDKYSLRIETKLQSTGSKIIYFLVDKNGKRFVLKVHKNKNTKLKVEQIFLSKVMHFKYRYVQFPHLIEYGDDYILVDYIEREHFTRHTILEREWSIDDIRLWVSGLIEFQNIEIASTHFSVKQRLMGIIYPVCHIFILLPKCRKLIDLKALAVIFKTTLNYFISRFF